jgi:hypothetical protein
MTQYANLYGKAPIYPAIGCAEFAKNEEVLENMKVLDLISSLQLLMVQGMRRDP